jgi:protein-S-isoprenylcysteine O-methyltransferase Ste14
MSANSNPAMSVRRKGWLLVAAQFVLIGLNVVIPGDPDASHSPALGTALFWIGIAALLWAFATLGKSLTAHPEPLQAAKLKVTGMYRIVRHPIYVALLTILLGSGIHAPSALRWLMFLMLAGLLFYKARWEESLLRAKYPDYAEYPQLVPMFVPGLKLLR